MYSTAARWIHQLQSIMKSFHLVSKEEKGLFLIKYTYWNVSSCEILNSNKKTRCWISKLGICSFLLNYRFLSRTRGFIPTSCKWSLARKNPCYISEYIYSFNIILYVYILRIVNIFGNKCIHDNYLELR